ncbi:antitoxin MazE family protein [Candidatus Kaiserbacteria bacterium]|nr:antitoxin MazE family protein [Candidatus Kaiserbacteria bacterium]
MSRTQTAKSKSRLASVAAKMQRYRARLRRKGLRLVQIWVPDTRARGFAEEARRQSLAVSKSREERADIAFVEGLLADNFDLPKT